MKIGQFAKLLKKYISFTGRTNKEYLLYFFRLFYEEKDVSYTEDEEIINRYENASDGTISQILSGITDIDPNYAQVLYTHFEDSEFKEKFDEINGNQLCDLISELRDNGIKATKNNCCKKISDYYYNLLKTRASSKDKKKTIKSIKKDSIKYNKTKSNERVKKDIINASLDTKIELYVKSELNNIVNYNVYELNMRCSFKDYFVCNDYYIANPDSNHLFNVALNVVNTSKSIQDNTLNDFVLNNNIMHFIILGGGGIGKSTFLKNIYLHTLEKNKELNLVPLFINARDINSESVEEIIPKKLNLTSEEQQYLIDNNKIILFIDGLDETNKTDLSNILKEIDKLKNLRIILSSRPMQELNFLNYYRRVLIKPFSEEQIKKYINNIYLIDKNECHLRLLDKLTSYENKFKSIKNIPLYLSMIVEINKYNGNIPESKSKLFQQLFELLYNKHDIEHKPYYRELKTGLKHDELLELISIIAYKLFVSVDKKNNFTKNELKSILLDIKNKNNKYLNVDSEDLITDLVTNVPIIHPSLESEVAFNFIQQTFKEYFIAYNYFLNIGINNYLMHMDFILLEDDITDNQILPLFSEIVNDYKKSFDFEKFIIYPFLRTYINEDTSYEDYLTTEYQYIYVYIGNCEYTTYNTPTNYILSFAKSFYNIQIPNLNIKNFNKDVLEKYLNDTYLEKDEKMEYLSSEEAIDYYYESLGDEKSEIGWEFCIEPSMVFDDKETNKEAYASLTDTECDFYKEYIFFKNKYSELQQKYEEDFQKFNTLIHSFSNYKLSKFR